MHDNRRNLMDAYLRCIVIDEGFAREIAAIADECVRDRNHAVAKTMRDISRNHRIRGMESRAQIAALKAEYDGTYGEPVDY
ncbi:hypothetical protein [Methylobacterium sp. E-066]|uniref:hypothetical protein n=1 Tax=Methylobacterium sp. E-066 TaxID=2836584 RepID=UPI001FBB896F|nr:hypothetical protein [Methylobacterium sp. E-066]MCJ2139977.1 hypothetical protein [Methylobacterium sp. E-066]